MINRFAGTCSCGAAVPCGRGTAARDLSVNGGGKWGVRCRACSGPARAMGAVTLGITFDGFVSISPMNHLGEEGFAVFRRACNAAGARHQRGMNRNIAPLDHYPGIEPAFTREGFAVTLSEQLRAALAARAANMRAALEGAEARADAVDAALKAEGRALYVPYQRDGVAFLGLRTLALLYDEPGLGKTVQGLAALPGAGAPVLVVGPAAARSVWTKHVPLWRPDLKAAALDGLKSFRWPTPGELLVTTWKCMPACEDVGNRLIAPEGCHPGTVLIADEAHVLLNPQTIQARRFRALARAVVVAGGRVWLMTGTPVMNARPAELWSLLDSVPGLAAEAFGDWPHYVGLWGGRITAADPEKGEVGGRTVWPRFPRPSPEIGERLRRVALGRKLRDVLTQIPPERDEDIDVPLDEQTRLAFDEAKGELDTLAIEIARTARGELSEIPDDEMKFGKLMKARRLVAAAKLEMLVQVVTEEYERIGEPVVVFSAHRAPMEHLAKRPGWGLIAGGVSADQRGHLEDEFQAGRLKGLAMTITAGGVALTLTRARFGIFLDWDWNPKKNDQSRARLVRATQQNAVLFRHLVADHEVDRRVRALCVRKEKVNDAALAGGPAIDAEARIRAFEVPT